MLNLEDGGNVSCRPKDDDGLATPKNQSKLISDNPYFKTKNLKGEGTTEKSWSQLYRAKMQKESDEQRKRRLMKNKIAAAKVRQQKIDEFEAKKLQAIRL